MTEPIDLKHLDLYVMGDKALLDEILSIFIEQARLLSDALSRLPGGPTWREAAHKLKGAARGVGAWALGDLAEAAEIATDGGSDSRKEIADKIALAATEAVDFALAVRDRAA